MDVVKRYYWNDSLEFIERYYAEHLDNPLQSYFYIDDDKLYFKREAQLHPEVRRMVTEAFNALY